MEPGAFRTDLFGKGAAYFSEENPAYREKVGATLQTGRGSDDSRPGDPAKAAAAIQLALEAEKDPDMVLMIEKAQYRSLQRGAAQRFDEVLCTGGIFDRSWPLEFGKGDAGKSARRQPHRCLQTSPCDPVGSAGEVT
ncbi:hypothetical protein [Streptomyces sp. NBC_01538]|uniref:hypothetical protein n=1 Tax=Streptomyces sp. NBC_01538 TaxID=2903897 RepID=UPI00386543E8